MAHDMPGALDGSSARARLAALEARVAALEARLTPIEDVAAPARPTTVTVGELLRRRRRALRQRQWAAALALDVDQSTVSKWERGDRMAVRHLAAIAAYTGLDNEVLARTYTEQFGGGPVA